MSIVLAPDEEEAYLLAILEAADGLDLAEFSWYDPESSDGCYRAWDYQWCLQGDTIMYTDQGRRKIKDVVGPVRLLTGGQGDRGEWVDAEVRQFGSDVLWAITVERRGVTRTIEATARHRWFSGQGRADRRSYSQCITSELQPGDYLQPMAAPNQSLEMDRIWVQAGVVFGDGTRQGGRSLVRLYGAKRALAEHFDVDGTVYTGHTARTEAVQIRGLPGWYKNTLPEVGQDKPAALWGWLAGYFATDGSVLPDGTCVISSVDPKAMFRVRDIATALGIVVSGVGHRTRTSVLPNGREHTCADLRVVLRAGDLPAEFFLHPGHRSRVEQRGEVRARAVDAWRVVSVECTGRIEPVFCAMVADTHSFVLDGDILTGNSWYTSTDTYQVDQGARATGKTVGITMRASALPFAHAGQKMLLTAPELNHLRPLTDAVEQRLLSTRLLSEMLPDGKGRGMNRQPHWSCRFKNGSQLVSRLPNKDGKGVKGQHVLLIELDEAQDYPLAGWIEIVETLNRFMPGAMWRCHGVPKGVRDKFFEMTEGGSDEDRQWTVHRPRAMNRPSWSPEERNEKIKEYGGSRQSIDFKRNIYGEHGDASNSVFVLSRLMSCVDVDEASEYNSEVYQRVIVQFERLPTGPSITDDIRQASLMSLIDLPGSHLTGYSQIVDRREVGAPKGYSAYYGGADIGVTNHPSEFLIFGQRTGTDVLELLTRINLQRINTDDQKAVIERLFEFYGTKLKAFALDKTGVGFPIWDQLSRHPLFGGRIYGYNFSEKVPVAFEDRPLKGAETKKDLAIWRNVVEATTDLLRNDYVDSKRLRLPYDREVLLEFQGQTYCCDADTEVLTKRGWLRYDQVEAGDETLGLRPDMVSEWTPIGAVHVFPAQPRQLVHLTGQAHESLTTPDHRWFGRTTNAGLRGQWRTTEQLLAEKVNFRIPLAAPRGDDVEPKYDDDLVELVAWYYTEGTALSTGNIGLAQSPVASPLSTARIEALLLRMLGPGDRNLGRGRRGAARWSVTDSKSARGTNQYRVLDRELSALVRSIACGPEKVVSPEFLTALSLEQLELFIAISLAADGNVNHRQRPGRQQTVTRFFSQRSKSRSDSFVMACALSGQGTQTRYVDGMYKTCVLRRQGAHASSLTSQLVSHDGPVWCPETGLGTWLARRNGRVFFTGNTVIKDSGNPYGTKRLFGGGSFHTLDAAKMVMAGKVLPTIAELLEDVQAQAPVLDVFVGGSGYGGGMPSF